MGGLGWAGGGGREGGSGFAGWSGREPGRGSAARTGREPAAAFPLRVSLASLARSRWGLSRVSAPWPGTRHRRRAAARSHTRQAVSFAPPKQAQALQVHPLKAGNPSRRSRRPSGASLAAPAPPVARLRERECRFAGCSGREPNRGSASASPASRSVPDREPAAVSRRVSLASRLTHAGDPAAAVPPTACLASLTHAGREPRPRFRALAGDPAPAAGRARSHACQAVSFAPPKQTQALKSSPTQGREPKARPRQARVSLRSLLPPKVQRPARMSRFAASVVRGHGRNGPACASLASPAQAGRAPARSLPARASLASLPTQAGNPAPCPRPGWGPGTGGGPQPDPIPLRRLRSRRPNKHRPLKAHPQTSGTRPQPSRDGRVSLRSPDHAGDPAAAVSPTACLASLAHTGPGPETRPRERVSRFARPPPPGTRPRFRAQAGDPAPAAGRARSHTPQAASFAPPKQAQALQTAPTKTGNPAAAVSRRASLASLARSRRGPSRSRLAHSLSRFARPLRPGTRHRRRAAARSHACQAVSFAPPKQAQALKTSPTNTGNPAAAVSRRASLASFTHNPRHDPASARLASLARSRRGPDLRGLPVRESPFAAPAPWEPLPHPSLAA
ncbi:hypothetical protein HNR73_001196 [Phytomonospora endophytica]|uniref:Uncharacterized protein n=1 Tax=Phytomonospora endophytica TaxID=714109 RepID=A0A841FL39_9ACTN|nr:hypothetical protein [Phytomonospora endophytica]